MGKGNAFHKGGGVFLLLPLLLYSYNPKGLSISYSSTDNIYLLDIKDRGSIMSVSPFLSYDNFIDFQYYGNFSIINFDNSNLFIDNYIELQRKVYLPGVGNKNIFYLNFYNFFSSSYDIYRLYEVALGDSLNIYLRNNYLFSSGIELKYKVFPHDSINNYIEPGVNLSIAIPLPYFFFTPRVFTGFRIFNDELMPFYEVSSSIYFPLTLDFSLNLSFSYYNLQPPDTGSIIIDTYLDDPFYEVDAMKEMTEFNIKLFKLFSGIDSRVDLSLNLYNKSFFEVDNISRNDKGFKANIKFSKMLSENLITDVKFESYINSSTFSDFEYTRNTVGLSLQLIF
jgi:hypothetical protein